MAQAQAFVQTCDDFEIQKPLQEFFENTLNLYAVDLKTDLGGIKEIFEGTPKRDWIFENLKQSVEKHNVERVILINHTNCAAYGGSDAFTSEEEEIHTHEIQLRHAVSDVKAKFPQLTVEAYLIILGKLDEPTKIQQVI
ncbi:MAG: hypothetical protein KW802_03620 [Candidatus Doudnabacteria bacterium]|nr:hypothetical protein [Candidatus Doudnabacteria bacterium]